MNLNRITFFLIIFFLTSVSCTRLDKNKTYTIAFSQCVQDDAWRKNMLIEMKRELSFHPNIDFQLYDAQGKSDRQIDQIEQILNKGIDLLIVSPNESEPLSPIVDQVYQQGTPVIVVDRKTSTEHYNAYVGSNNYQVGRLAALTIFKNNANVDTKNKNIIYITGLINSSASIEREKGFLDGLQEFKVAGNLVKLNGNWLPESAPDELRKIDRDQVENAAYIFCFNDPMALATSHYLNSLKLPHKPRIIGVDGLLGNGNGLQNVKDGYIFATIHYPTGGKETIRTAVDILEKKRYQRNIDLGTMIIDSSNVQLLLDLENKLNDQYKDIDKQQIVLSNLKSANKLEKFKSTFFLTLLLFSCLAILLILYIIRNLKKSKAIISENHQTITLQNKELETLNNELNNNLNEKLNLFKNLSFSLSNPIALLYSSLKELQHKSNQYSVEQVRTIHHVQNITNRLNNVYHDIKNLEHIHNNTDRGVEMTDFASMINQIIYQLSSLINEKKIKITVENNLHMQHIDLSKKWIERALYNYIEFLIKSFPEGSILHFKLNSLLENPGIHLKTIIGPFTNAELKNFNLHKNSKLGVGITFFQDVVNQHNGNIQFSQDDNFTILEITFYALDPAPSENGGSDPVATPYRYEEHSEIETIPHLQDKANLLYIDNDPSWPTAVRAKFGGQYNVYLADSYTQAQKMLDKHKFEVIIAESKINTSTYTTFVQTLRNTSAYNTIPFIIFSTSDNIEQREQAFLDSCDMFVIKNDGLQLLENGINNIVRRQKNIINKHLKISEKDVQLLENAKNRSDHSRFVDDINHIIQHNISNSKFNIADLAKELNISRVHLYNRFNEIFQVTPSEYILEIRLKKALHLLNSSLTIAEIAYQCGFSSPGYFTKVFSGRYKHNPKTYQKLHSGK